MNFSLAAKIMTYCAIPVLVTPAFSHLSMERETAPAGTAYKAVFWLGHGCQGAATTAVAVQIPDGFQAARPYAKAGWTLATERGTLAKPYQNHGKLVTEDVTVVRWTAASRDAAVADTHTDEFMLRGKLPETAGPLWFKVLQT